MDTVSEGNLPGPQMTSPTQGHFPKGNMMEPGRLSVVVLGVLFEGSLAGLAWMLGWLVGQSPVESLRAEPRSALVGVAATVPLLFFFLGCVRSTIGPLARIREFFKEVLRPIFAQSTLLDFAFISVAAGVGEEMLFRGVIQPALARWTGIAASVALTSALFGLLHPITPTYVVIAGAMGAYLGLAFVATGNLLVVVVAHAVYDFVALVILLRTDLATPLVPTEGHADPPGQETGHDSSPAA